jgi:transposase
LGKVSEGKFSQAVTEVVSQKAPNLLPALTAMLDVLALAGAQAKELKKSLEARCAQDAVSQRLESTPGIGPLISTAYRATIDDPHRFSCGDEVADYLGLTPRVYQSGEVEYRGRITKEGDRLLRWHLVEGAHVLLTKGKDCALKRWGLSLEKRKGSGKAKVAVARKLAILLWKLWKDEQLFEAFPSSV